MKRRYFIFAVVALLLAGGTGFLGYTRGVEAGRAQANDIRSEFYRSRGIAGVGGGAGAAASGSGGPMLIGPAAAPAPGGASGPAAGAGGSGASNVFSAGATIGRIQEVSGDTIVIQGREGSVTVKLAENTAVMRQARADRAQLRDGMSVSVIGEKESDGTVTARAITILGGQGQGGETGTPPPANEPVTSGG